ncbi:MAG: YHS domain-containing protein [Acidiferrobacterales bacterium]|nr:YHS domain-containing protein [Acidiferrobacterales bacterium]
MNKLFKLMILVVSALWTGNSFALDPIYTSTFSNNAIRGYDTVAYFIEGKAVEGNKDFATQYMQATWLFSSQQHLDLFLAEPEKYAPQYGGYCAYAVSQNTTASIKPELFTIHEGKLYLNYNKNVNEKWLANKQQFILDADKNWPALLAE